MPAARPAAALAVQVVAAEALLVAHLQARQVPRRRSYRCLLLAAAEAHHQAGPESSSHQWDHQPVPSRQHATLRQDTQLAKTGSLSHAGAREAALRLVFDGFSADK